MAKSIIKKMKGLFMSKDKKKEADTNKTDADPGFEVLNDAQAPDANENAGALDDQGVIEEETTVGVPVESDSISENKPESAPRAEKTHERVARIAAEMNTKGYGL